MPSKNPAQRLRDIVDNVDAIAEFTAKRTSQLSSRRLPAEIRKRHGEIDWVAVAEAGNVYRHEYETVDVRQGLAALRGMATTELDQLRSA